MFFMTLLGIEARLLSTIKKHGYFTIRKVHKETPNWEPHYCFVGFNSSNNNTINVEWAEDNTTLIGHDFSLIEKPKLFKIKKKRKLNRIRD